MNLFVGDELFSDIYPMEVVDGIFYKVKGKVIHMLIVCTVINRECEVKVFYFVVCFRKSRRD